MKHVEEPKNEENTEKAQDVAAETNVDQEEIPAAEKTPQLSSPPVKAAPKSWADLVRTKAPVNTSNANHIEQSTTSLSKELDIGTNNSLAEVLSSFSVNDRGNANKIAFLKPRGLVNTGNMCYMNSVIDSCICSRSCWTNPDDRFSKFLYFAYLFILFWTGWVSRQLIVSIAKLH